MIEFCHLIVNVLTFTGVIIMLIGGTKTLIGFLVFEARHLFSLKNEMPLDDLRGNFGAYLLLGLEFSVAADIIETFIEPTRENLIILGVLVVIRTVISYFIGREREELHKAATAFKQEGSSS